MSAAKTSLKANSKALAEVEGDGMAKVLISPLTCLPRLRIEWQATETDSWQFRFCFPFQIIHPQTRGRSWASTSSGCMRRISSMRHAAPSPLARLWRFSRCMHTRLSQRSWRTPIGLQRQALGSSPHPQTAHNFTNMLPLRLPDFFPPPLQQDPCMSVVSYASQSRCGSLILTSSSVFLQIGNHGTAAAHAPLQSVAA